MKQHTRPSLDKIFHQYHVTFLDGIKQSRATVFVRFVHVLASDVYVPPHCIHVSHDTRLENDRKIANIASKNCMMAKLKLHRKVNRTISFGVGDNNLNTTYTLLLGDSAEVVVKISICCALDLDLKYHQFPVGFMIA